MNYPSLLCGRLSEARIYIIFFIIALYAIPLSALNCSAHLNLSLGPDCELEITPGMLVTDPGINLADLEVELSYDGGVVISDGILRYRHIGRKIKAKVSCQTGGCGSCWTEIELSADILPVFASTLDTAVYCFDSLLIADPGSTNYQYHPALMPSCVTASGPHFSGDWIETRQCDESSDTAKIVYREWYAESKAGTRVVAFDTIHVLRLPSIDGTVHCADVDTSYCDSPDDSFGPYMVLENPIGSEICDTIYLLSMGIEQITNASKCGLSIKVDTTSFDPECGDVTAYDVEIIQRCHSTATPFCTASGLQVDVGATIPGERVFGTCTFWHMVLDTVAPEVECIDGKDTIQQGDTTITVIAATSHECIGEILLPSATITDVCGGAKFVKARIDSTATITYQRGSSADLWEPTGTVTLPVRSQPYEIILEAYDSCHNLGVDSCYILVKDLTRPVAVAHDTLNLGLSGKKIWMRPESFDHGSWDNCSDELLFYLRRTDWEEFCVDLCDSTTMMVGTANPDDTLNCVYLNDDESADPIEAYYRNYIEWLAADGEPCSALLSAAWHYALCQIGEVDCLGELDQHAFLTKYQRAFEPEDLTVLGQIGGGWADAVPISCEDLCSEVSVEMLVMDYWCNWSTSWTRVYVEDKVPPVAVSTLQDTADVSCTAYENDRQYVVAGQAGNLTLEDVVNLAVSGDQNAFVTLDAILGSYIPAWQSSNGDFLDADGNHLETSFTFTDRGACRPDTNVQLVRYLDPSSGTMMSNPDSMVVTYVLDTIEQTWNQGYVLTNCNANLQSRQTISVGTDSCGHALITRTFKMWKECAGASVEPPDTFCSEQIVRTVTYCETNEYMFSFPQDTILEVSACSEIPDLVAGQAGGIADPSLIGEAQFIFDASCRRPAVGFSDLVKRIVPAPTNQFCDTIIMRSWIVADWCPETLDTVVQKIGFRVTPPTPNPTPEASINVQTLAVKQAYPNPFREETVLTLSLESRQEIALSVVDVKGRRVLDRRMSMPSGDHQVVIRREDLQQAGMYFYRVRSGDQLQVSGKLVMIE